MFSLPCPCAALHLDLTTTDEEENFLVEQWSEGAAAADLECLKGVFLASVGIMRGISGQEIRDMVLSGRDGRRYVAFFGERDAQSAVVLVFPMAADGTSAVMARPSGFSFARSPNSVSLAFTTLFVERLFSFAFRYFRDLETPAFPLARILDEIAGVDVALMPCDFDRYSGGPAAASRPSAGVPSEDDATDDRLCFTQGALLFRTGSGNSASGGGATTDVDSPLVDASAEFSARYPERGVLSTLPGELRDELARQRASGIERWASAPSEKSSVEESDDAYHRGDGSAWGFGTCNASCARSASDPVEPVLRVTGHLSGSSWAPSSSSSAFLEDGTSRCGVQASFARATSSRAQLQDLFLVGLTTPTTVEPDSAREREQAAGILAPPAANDGTTTGEQQSPRRASHRRFFLLASAQGLDLLLYELIVAVGTELEGDSTVVLETRGAEGVATTTAAGAAAGLILRSDSDQFDLRAASGDVAPRHAYRRSAQNMYVFYHAEVAPERVRAQTSQTAKLLLGHLLRRRSVGSATCFSAGVQAGRNGDAPLEADVFAAWATRANVVARAPRWREAHALLREFPLLDKVPLMNHVVFPLADSGGLTGRSLFGASGSLLPEDSQVLAGIPKSRPILKTKSSFKGGERVAFSTESEKAALHLVLDCIKNPQLLEREQKKPKKKPVENGEEAVFGRTFLADGIVTASAGVALRFWRETGAVQLDRDRVCWHTGYG